MNKILKNADFLDQKCNNFFTMQQIYSAPYNKKRLKIDNLMSLKCHFSLKLIHVYYGASYYYGFDLWTFTKLFHFY
jgi:hypothetical protein